MTRLAVLVAQIGREDLRDLQLRKLEISAVEYIATLFEMTTSVYYAKAAASQTRRLFVLFFTLDNAESHDKIKIVPKTFSEFRSRFSSYSR
jgi:hypothetical protein